MAGDWIKMRCDLHEDPSVFRLATITKCDRFLVVGRLHAFWSWADKYAVDGRVDGATSQVVDDVVRQPGFADALVAVKWLIVGEDFVSIPKPERHNGESAKERGLKNARQARWRDKKDNSAPTSVDAKPSTKASTREEKRREELKEEDKSSCAATSATPAVPPVLTLPALQDKRFVVHQEYIDRLQTQFPACHVEPQLRKMQAWLEANPRKGKTLQGLPRFIVNWLGKEQDRGGDIGRAPPAAKESISGRSARDEEAALRVFGGIQ